ncbi:MAG: 30S ribosomal protein S6 [Dehalococcoidia bacterium]
MRRYELTVIITPDVAEDDLPDAIDRLVKRPVESGGGEMQGVDVWGRRRLAYPIQRHLEGNYVLTQLQLDPQQTTELERGLQISEEVIRHLLVRLEEEQPA